MSDKVDSLEKKYYVLAGEHSGEENGLEQRTHLISLEQAEKHLQHYEDQPDRFWGCAIVELIRHGKMRRQDDSMVED